MHNDTTTRFVDPVDFVELVDLAGWSRDALLDRLRGLERLRRQVDAATTLVIAALGPNERDTAATVATTTGTSTRRARERTLTARTTLAIPGARDALLAGTITDEHLRALARVKEPDDATATSLLAIAATQTPDEFDDTITQHLVDTEPDDLAKRQHDARSIKFFNADHGCLGARVILPPTAGEELRNKLNAIVEAAYRALHPERARTVGGHNDEPHERRLADALMSLVRSDNDGKARSGGKPTVVVTIDPETMAARLAGVGPLPLPSALDVLLDPRTVIYAHVQSMRGEILKFGTSRRFASAMQRLALIVRDQHCQHEGCDRHWRDCQAHHLHHAADDGPTDIDELKLVCTQHHQHHHRTPGRRALRRRRCPTDAPSDTSAPHEPGGAP